MANKMLIDATHPEETRVVVLRGNRVEEFDFETAQRKQLRGNIYLAKVTRVEPSLQAAFVDYGGNRHGFLAFSEIHPDYYQIPMADRQALLAEDERAHRDEDEDERQGRHRRGRNRHRDARRRNHRDDTVRSDTFTSEDMPHATADLPAGEHAMGEPSHDAPLPAAADVPIEAAPAPAPEHQAAPVGETANPPIPAEGAAPAPQPDAAPPTAETSGVTRDGLVPGEHRDAPPPFEGAAPSGDNGDAVAAAEGGNGHGADEEEEVVESVGGADAMEEVPDRAPRYRRQYKIQEVIKRRQIMLVQVVKEERGTKGAALTTYLSLAGRYCVLMPNTARGGGISRKITSPEDRRKLREIADELEVPEGMGVILRTAGAARTKQEVRRDFEYLLRMWETVRDLTLKSTAPNLVYEEGSLAKRSIRDLYSKDIEEIVVAGESGYRDAKDFMRMLMPSHARNVKLYADSQPIFTRYGIESQLDAMFSPTVQLRSGGYIVLNQTEALVSIDVNSGRSTREHHIEDTALKTNVEASEEIARQLRLRDLAGLIVIDFIDMDENRNNRTVERRLKDALRNDRARIQVGRISHFGLMEMSRQRIRTSVFESSTEKCAHCGGTGHMRSVASVSLQLLRSLEETLLKGATHNQIVRTRPEIALYVLNHKRAHLRMLEERFRIVITVNADPQAGGLTAFAIERGEQVMTMEQAKALLAQTEATPVIHQEEEEPEIVEEDIAEEPVEAADQAADAPAPVHQDGEPAMGDRNGGDRNGGEGARRGRRRRRRGRGRSGEGREHGQIPQAPREGGPFEPGQPAFDQPAQQFAPAGDGGAAPPDTMQGEAGFAPTPQPFGEPRTNGERTNGEGGDSEHRRRRRGRRGGRRNRRDRDGQDNFGGYAGGEPREPQPQTGEFGAPAGNTPYERPPAPVAEVADSYAPRGEPAPMQATPMPPPAPPVPPAPETSRRRSTVREPAPIFGTSAPAPMPAPPPQPAALPPAPAVAAAPETAEDASKPRRTGWWAKRLLGGDKG